MNSPPPRQAGAKYDAFSATCCFHAQQHGTVGLNHVFPMPPERGLLHVQRGFMHTVTDRGPPCSGIRGAGGSGDSGLGICKNPSSLILTKFLMFENTEEGTDRDATKKKPLQS